MKSKNQLFLTMLLALAATAGCELAGEPVWRHDSKGFVFTRADGSANYFDLAKGSSLQVVRPVGLKPCLPAISPDNQQVAMAVGVNGPAGHGVSLGFKKLDDGTAISHEKQTWGQIDDNCELAISRTFWCPTGKRLVATYGGGFSPHPPRAVVYEVASKTFTELRHEPMTFLYSAFGVSPLIPDGSGYLALRDYATEPVISVVSWDGWEKQITYSSQVKTQLVDAFGKLKTDEEKSALILPFPCGRWVGTKMILPLKSGNLVIDASGATAILVGKDKWTEAAATVSHVFDRIENETPFSVTPLTESLSLVCWSQKLGGKSAFGIDAFDAKLGRRSIVPPNHELAGFGNPLFPSPDGEYILAWLKKGDDSLIYVIDRRGAIVHRLNL